MAIDAATGEVRAVANHPVVGFPPALAGSYAPGSTFKVITATALLLAGNGVDTTVDCPSTLSVTGKTFRNHAGVTTGPISLQQAFADSCNTAFIGAARSLPANALVDAASLFGFGSGAPLPIASVGGVVPTSTDVVELAADAIGQGRVEASPLHMASVAAAVASGTWRQPHLLPCPSCTSHVLPPAVTPALQRMMRAVVTSGTGKALAAVGGGPVYAKTGTAEFGTASPPATHAWVIGYQGGLAFAVYVENGAGGGEVAAPIAAAFLSALRS